MSDNINSVNKPQAAGPFYIHASECGGRGANQFIAGSTKSIATATRTR